MQHHGQGVGFPRLVGNATRSLSVEGGIESSMQLGETPNNEGRQVVPGVCKLLSPFYFQICKDSSPINVLDMKKDVEMQWGPPQ